MSRKKKAAAPAVEASKQPIISRGWLDWGLILLAALFAHGLCLNAVFYLDDSWQIQNNQGIEGGEWWYYPPRLVPYATYQLTYQLFGMSAVTFHAGNLILHAATALVIYRLTGGLLRVFVPSLNSRQVASGGLAAGILFAAHPLASEVLNYTRCRAIEFVTFFSLLAAWYTLRWLREGWRWFFWVVACVVLASYSKEPGAVHVTANIALLAAAMLLAGLIRWDLLVPGYKDGRMPAFAWLALTSFASVTLLGAIFCYQYWYPKLVQKVFLEERFVEHFFTQARVFFGYLGRTVLPVGPFFLCSDHAVPWTVLRVDGEYDFGRLWMDWQALAAALLITAWCAFASWCLLAPGRLQQKATGSGEGFQRAFTGSPSWRLAGFLQLVFLFHLLVRLLYPSSELMVEYRVYPALFGVLCLAGWGVASCSRNNGVPLALVVVLAIVYGLLSMQRSNEWQSSESICNNVLRYYPYHNRARWELNEKDADAGRFKAVLERESEILKAYNDVRELSMSVAGSPPIRRYDNGHATLFIAGAQNLTARASGPVHGANHARRRFRLIRGQLLRFTRQPGGNVFNALWLNAHGEMFIDLGRTRDALPYLRAADAIAPQYYESRLRVQRIESHLAGN